MTTKTWRRLDYSICSKARADGLAKDARELGEKVKVTKDKTGYYNIFIWIDKKE